MSATNNCNNDDSVTFNDITDLARHYGSTSLEDLGRTFYDETSFGVNTTFLAACHPTLKEIYYESGEYPATRPLPNIWAGHFCTGIRFGTIVEGSDAEFTATDLHFPISLAEIQEAYDHLSELYDEAKAEAQWANEDWRDFHADDHLNDGERLNPDGPRYLDAKPENPID